jgi:hypothetical protein
MKEINDNVTLDVQAAALFLGVAAATLAKMRCMGGSPVFVKAGRKILYRREDLIAWLSARRVRNTSEAAKLLPRRLTEPLAEEQR